MNIDIDDKIQQKFTLINYLLGNKPKKVIKKNPTMPCASKIDSVAISREGQQLSNEYHRKVNNINTNIDKSIDLQKYIDEVKKENDKSIENAGYSIDEKNNTLKTYTAALYSALTDKYSRLLQDAKSHANPSAYIHDKYFNPSFDYYESDLSEEERSVAYNSEMDMLNTGKLMHIYGTDSLFRGMSFEADQEERYQLQRRMVNKQILNICERAGIVVNDMSNTVQLEINPYTYYISVRGTDDNTKSKLESALNQGENGENLFLHIAHSTQQGKCDSIQINGTSLLKYRASSAVYEYTGLKLTEMQQKGTEYYTKDGLSLREYVKSEISKKTNENHKEEAIAYLNYLLDEVGKINWNDTPDMYLKIQFSKNGLKDIGQELVFDGYSKINDYWYSVL